MNRLKSILIKCGITAVVGVGMVFLVLNLHGFSALSNQSEQFRLLADAFTIPGVIMIMVGLLIAADDEYSLFPPNITCLVNREVIGIVTKTDKASPERAERWLRLAGCKKVFCVDSHTGNGTKTILEYLEKQ